MKFRYLLATVVLGALLGLGLFSPGRAAAHCDTMDGPVVQTAREALQTGNINPVLAWVEARDEAEVRTAFAAARGTRGAGPEPQEAADRQFFETVVRLHRASEGEPFTGLKPAGTDLGPVVPQADAALQAGSADPLVAQVTGAVEDGIRDRFTEVMSAKNYDRNDVQAGREYVAAYVQYMHFAEEIYDASQHTAADAHASAPAPSARPSAGSLPMLGGGLALLGLGLLIGRRWLHRSR